MDKKPNLQNQKYKKKPNIKNMGVDIDKKRILRNRFVKFCAPRRHLPQQVQRLLEQHNRN